jgi:hypothetical protein
MNFRPVLATAIVVLIMAVATPVSVQDYTKRALPRLWR